MEQEFDLINRVTEEIKSGSPSKTSCINELISDESISDEIKQIALHRKIDDYNILARTGKGGLGGTFLAEKQGNKKEKYIIKVPLQPKDNDVLVHEILVFQKIGQFSQIMAPHPNIVTVIESYVKPNSEFTYLVLECLEEPITPSKKIEAIKTKTVRILAEVVNEGNINDRRLAKLIYNVANALEFCHSTGVFPGDIKPENIRFTREENEYERTAKIFDFGAANTADNYENEKLFITFAYAHPGFVKDLKRYPAFPKDAPQKSAETIFKKRDYSCLALTIYSYIAGKEPYTNTTNSKSLFSNAKTIEEKIKIIEENNPINHNLLDSIYIENKELFACIINECLNPINFDSNENISEKIKAMIRQKYDFN